MSEQLKVSSSPHIRSKETTGNIMLWVIIALLPATFFGIYNFRDTHAWLLVIVTTAAAVLTEYIYEKLMHKKITIKDFSAAVTGLLLALNLPPTTPIWMGIIGSVFAILVVKQLFGGLGQNFMNPALGARCFLLISFTGRMTSFVYDGVSGATPLATIRANIEAGNEQQLVIKRLVESYSLSIGPTKAYGVICAVATLERIYTKYGYHVLDRTLRLCVGTWEGDIDSLGANVLAGVARMVVAFGDQLRDEIFKERVGFMSVRQLSRIAKERGAGSLCYAEAMLVAYNRKCKYTLRMTKLHSGKVAAEDDFVEENEEPLADDPVLEE